MIRQIIITVLLTASLASCTTSRKLASQFVMREDNLHVLILPPAGLLKKYYTANPFDVDSVELQPGDLQESRFLKEMNDTAFVNYYLRSLRFHLEQFQINVYGPDLLDTFFQIDTIAYIFSMAQIELIEYPDEHLEYTWLDTTIYRISLDRNNIEHSTWFEFTELNNPDRNMDVLYSMQRTSDYYDGRFVFDRRSGGLIYRHTPFYVETSDVYNLAYFAGQQNAQYIFDFLMNQYVAEQSRRPPNPDRYLQYDNERHAIRRAYNDRFIKLKSPQNEASD